MAKIESIIIDQLEEPLKSKVYIRHQLTWSLFPICPLERKKETESMGKELGYLVAGKGLRVYLGNIYDIDKYFKVLESIPFLEYRSIGALLNDGWRVD